MNGHGFFLPKYFSGVIPFSFNHAPSLLPLVGGSDHSIVLWKLKNKLANFDIIKRQIQKISPVNAALFTKRMHQINWICLIQSILDVNTTVEVFQATLL